MATLRLFAQAREAAGTNKIDIDADSVAAVLDQARINFGSGFSAVLDGSRVWLNGSPAELDAPVSSRDEVAVLPPVSGG